MQDFTSVIYEGNNCFGPTNIYTEIHDFIIHYGRSCVTSCKKSKSVI
jgi:diphthamide synthase subunit DPH2